jgi:hypothetical protein
MTQLSYRKKKDNTPQIIGALLFLILFFAYQFHFKDKWFGKNKGGNSDSGQVESILSKEEHMLTVDEWKKIADYRAEEFYECTKDLDMDITKWYLYESCATSYNNNWVRFRDGLDERANLNYDQREMLKDYWHKTRDAMTEKVSNLMKANDKKLRPNREN